MKSRIITLLLVLISIVYCVGQPTVEHGLLDARPFDFKHDKIALNGEWHFFQSQLVAPEALSFKPDEFRYFPKLWNKIQSSGQGYATYGIQVLVSPELNELALEIPAMYSSYNLWVNNKLIAINGKVGPTESETLPQWLPQTQSFANDRDTLKIVLQIANFNHFKGGSKNPVYLGSSEFLQQHRSKAVVSNVVEAIVLGVLAISFLVVYFSMERKKVVMYFALLCLTWAIRVGFSNLYVFISLFPDFNWNMMVRIEYITLFMTMIWAILFLGRMFVKEDNKIVKYLLVGSNCIFIAFALVSSPVSFTRWLMVYLSFSGLLLTYCTILVLRAWVNERVGATFLTISIMLGVLIFTYDILSYQGVFGHNPIVFSVGYILIFSLVSVVLLQHLNILKSKPRPSSVLTYEELYKNNDLLTK